MEQAKVDMSVTSDTAEFLSSTTVLLMASSVMEWLTVALVKGTLFTISG